MSMLNADEYQVALFERLLLSAFILLLPFQDTALQGTFLRFLGASPAFIPILLLLLFRLVRIKASTTVNRFTFFLVFITALSTLLVSYYSVFVYINKYHLSFLAYKIFSNSILYFLAFYAIFAMRYKKINVGNFVIASFFLAVGGPIVTTFFHFRIFEYPSIFHFTPNFNLRLRGFSMEASDFGATIGGLSLISAHYARKLFRPFILIVGSAAIFLCFSKGSIAAWIISMFLILVYTYFHDKITYKKFIIYAFLFCVASIAFFVGYNYVLGMLSQSLPTTTIPTRVTMAVTALYISLISPLGVGFSGVVPAVSQNVPHVVHFLQNIGLNNLNYTEVLGYVNDPTGHDISAKNFFFTGIMIWGIPFMILYIWFNATIFIRLWKYNNSPYLFGAFIFSFVAISSYVGLLNLYCLSVCYGILYETCFWQGANRIA
ncbi:hypothetical protein [Acidithiobacillus ferridurans]|uniref:Uncharacterized protein n=2 Tax=Acidithiobacillus ferridurans TaxID=1232575 RepID=A0A2Z6IK78_ACIFI|nr:hypothetical protein [Acidithiobacillus ferridurans]MBU2716268.1 hypothetical protein [Acidithiobacillus ferridurans]MBU2723560.1 hypothetical protein [Acidithiobacillus ferridurans]BBF65117.1 hypothetical protein AFERRID_13350 [Acidithiobacillus ferridurans]